MYSKLKLVINMISEFILIQFIKLFIIKPLINMQSQTRKRERVS